MSLFIQEVLSYNGIFVRNLFAEPGGENVISVLDQCPDTQQKFP